MAGTLLASNGRVTTMAPRKPTSDVAPKPASGSWMALLASTTLGNGADTLRAEVRADGLAEGSQYRLVVQSYDESGPRAKPVGSVQRAVTGADLRRGVQINLLELRGAGAAPANEGAAVMAWIEAGEPDLEFDGRRARPAPGSVYGVVKRSGAARVQISLNRRHAA
jgi:hypothetical protein